MLPERGGTAPTGGGVSLPELALPFSYVGRIRQGAGDRVESPADPIQQDLIKSEVQSQRVRFPLIRGAALLKCGKYRGEADDLGDPPIDTLQRSVNQMRYIFDGSDEIGPWPRVVDTGFVVMRLRAA